MGELGAELARNALQQRVLIVERGADAAQALQAKLAQAGFSVSTVDESERAVAAIQRNSPHLVMLDWDLPGVIAIDLIRKIRSSSADHPPRLIILSMLSDDDQVVTGFELGADDYVVKPYSVVEVVARVRAVLRSIKEKRDDAQVLRFHELELHVDEGRVSARQQAVPLRAMEYRVLEFLMRHPGRVFSRAQLLNRVWGENCRAQERAVDVIMQRIRKALACHRCEGYLQTVRSIGYRMSADSDVPAAPLMRPAE
jgi:two-component system phosphate regulon response regulator PhoB